MALIMRILILGDIVGHPGRKCVAKVLRDLKNEYNINLCIANGENAKGGRGLSVGAYDELINCGVDVITTGNHVWDNREIHRLFDENKTVLRPANYPPSNPGNGYILYDMGKYVAAVINLMGRVMLDAVDCPFRKADEILEEIKDKCKITIVDFHAEATSEKQAMGFYLDGRVSAVFGTHTHVQTADGRILPKGTGYITDVGMCGTVNSVIGMNTELAVNKFINKTPIRLELCEDSECMINGVIFEVDDAGKTTGIERIYRYEG